MRKHMPRKLLAYLTAVTMALSTGTGAIPVGADSEAQMIEEAAYAEADAAVVTETMESSAADTSAADSAAADGAAADPAPAEAAPEEPAPTEAPASEEPAPTEAPAPEEPAPTKAPAPEEPAPTEAPAPEEPAPTEAPAPEEPTPTEAPAPTAAPTPTEAPTDTPVPTPTADPTETPTPTPTEAPDSTVDSKASAVSSVESEVPEVYVVPADQQPALAVPGSLPEGQDTLKHLMGSFWNYGIVADEIDFTGQDPSVVLTQKTNFVTGKITGDVKIDENVAGDVPLIFRVAEVDGTMQVVSDRATMDFHIPAGSEDAISTEAGTVSYVNQTNESLTEDLSKRLQRIYEISAGFSGQNHVALTIAGADAVGPHDEQITLNSTEDNGQTTTVTLPVPQMVIDTTADTFSDNAVFYFAVTSADVAKRIADGELQIRKKGHQKIVITYAGDAAEDVKIGKYQITVDGRSGDSSASSDIDFLRDAVSDAVVWNLPNTRYVTLAKTAGIVLAPTAKTVTLAKESQVSTQVQEDGSHSAETALANASTGMLLTSAKVEAETTWQFMNQSRTAHTSDDTEPTSVRLAVRSEVTYEAGKAPTEDATFTYTLTELADVEAAASENKEASEEAVEEANAGAAEEGGESTDAANADPTNADPTDADTTDASTEGLADTDVVTATAAFSAETMAADEAATSTMTLAAFEALSFSEEGNYSYRIAAKDAALAGFTSETAPVLVTVNVVMGDDGQLRAEVVKAEEAVDPTTLEDGSDVYEVGTFESAYADMDGGNDTESGTESNVDPGTEPGTESGVDPGEDEPQEISALTLIPTITKKVSYGAIPKKDLTFKYTLKQTKAPEGVDLMADKTAEAVFTQNEMPADKSEAEVEVAFEALSFATAGTYVYSIREAKNANQAEELADTTVRTLKVVVTEESTENGTILKATARLAVGKNGAVDTTVTEETIDGGIFSGKMYKPLTIVPQVTKTLTYPKGELPEEEPTFEFELSRQEDGAASTEVHTAELTFTEEEMQKAETGLTAKVAFETLEFTAPGTYVYEAKEIQREAVGYIYDQTTYTMTVEVTANAKSLELTPSVIVKASTGTKKRITVKTGPVNIGTFENLYKIKPAKFTISAKSILAWTKGMPPVLDSVYQYMLREEDAYVTRTIATSMTAGNINKLLNGGAVDGYTLTSNASAEKQTAERAPVSYLAKTYRKTGVFHYELSEVDRGRAGYKYDSTHYKIAVHVELDEETTSYVVSKVVVTTDDGKEVDANLTGSDGNWTAATFDFTNTYRPNAVMYRMPFVKEVKNGENAAKTTFKFNLYYGKDGSEVVATGTADKAGVFYLKPNGKVHYNAALGEQYGDDRFFFTRPCEEWYRLEEDTSSLADGYIASNATWYLHVTIKDYGGQLKSTAVVQKADGTKARQIGVWYDKNEGKHVNATITNTWVTGSVSFAKVSSESTNTALGGAQFSLYKIAATDKTSEAYQNALANLKGGRVFDNNGRVSALLREAGKTSSGKNGKVSFSGLYPNQYYAIVETKAPTGYQISSNAIVIETGFSDGRFTNRIVSSGNFTLGRDSGGTWKWYDHPVSVRIDKVIPEGNLLKGAYLQLVDESGKVLEKWQSGKKNAHMVKAKLQVGHTYYVREVKAPKGYKKADPVTFTVSSLPTGGYNSATRIQVVKMVDESDGTKTDGSEIGGVPSDTGDGDTAAGTAAANGAAVKTGDTSPIGLYILLLALAAAAILGVLVIGRKKRK